MKDNLKELKLKDRIKKSEKELLNIYSSRVNHFAGAFSFIDHLYIRTYLRLYTYLCDNRKVIPQTDVNKL